MTKQKTATSLQANIDPVVEAKVDAMMNADPQPVKPVKGVAPLDAFAGQAPPIATEEPKHATAPLLPAAAPEPEPAPKPEPAPAPTPAAAAEADIAPLNIDTPQSDAAIADIVAQEADEVLAAQDAGIVAAAMATEAAPEPRQKHGHPLFWFMIVLLVIIAGLAAWVLSSPGLSPSL